MQSMSSFFRDPKRTIGDREAAIAIGDHFWRLGSGSRSQFLIKLGIAIAISILAIGLMLWQKLDRQRVEMIPSMSKNIQIRGHLPWPAISKSSL